MSEYSIKIADGKASIFTPYNKDFVTKIKLIGARWDAAHKCWTVDEDNVNDARGVMRAVYGRDDQEVGETVDVILHFEKDYECFRAPVAVFGRTIASAFGRDSGARVGDDAMFLEGAPTSAGSVKNWTTRIASGSIVKLTKVPKNIINDDDLPYGVTMEIVGETINRAALEAIEKLLNA